MPRLLSSYAANKRVEDGLRRKQEQIRQEYVRARHRYMDETDKLINDLIQIHVKTPNAFNRMTPPSSAPSFSRLGRGLIPSQGIQLPHHLTSQQQQQTTAEILEQTSQALRSRPRGEQGPLRPTEENARVGVGGSRSAPVRRVMPGVVTTPGAIHSQPPLVQIHGEEVFYQYDIGKRPGGWKKIEPAYRTKVLLHRNNTVSQALQRQQDLAAVSSLALPDSEVDAGSKIDPNGLPRKRSLYGAEARRDSELYARRDSLFSRRSSRRGSRLFEDVEDDLEEDLRAERFARLMQQQLSPGHTPRMLDGWTIMNWCLWNKQSEKPIWATKRYMDKKRREVKRYEASRNKEKKDGLAAKPSSAKTRPNGSISGPSNTEGLKQPELRRAKSVPLQGRETSRLEGVDEENEDELMAESETNADTSLNITELPDRGILRPTTSILRPSQHLDGFSRSENDDALRPKTTTSRRRVALDDFIQQDSLPNPAASSDLRRDQSSLHDKHIEFNSNLDSGPPSNRSSKGTGAEKGERERRRTISINDCPLIMDSREQGPLSPRPPPPSLVHSKVDGERADLEDRMPGLAATRIATSSADQTGGQKTLKSKRNQGSAKKLNSTQAGTVIFPKVKQVVPELGSDSPRQL